MYLEKFKLDILKHLERAMDTGYFQSDSKKKLKGWAFIRAWLYANFCFCVLPILLFSFFLSIFMTSYLCHCDPVREYRAVEPHSHRNLKFETLVRQSGKFKRGIPKTLRMSCIISSFNHGANIPRIAFPLSLSEATAQIIVVDDGSSDHSIKSWHQHLGNQKDMVLVTNNVHQLRQYNLAAKIASSNILAFMHDDDIVPVTDSWQFQALAMFEQFPKLCVLGGFIGEMTEGWEIGDSKSDNIDSYTYEIPFQHSKLKIPFMFISAVWTAPMFVRKSCWEEIGPFDTNLAPSGEPAIWLDIEYSLRAWTKGWQVALMHVDFMRGIGGHGTLKTEENKLKRKKMLLENQIYVKNLYGHRSHWFLKESMDLNDQFLEKRKGSEQDYSREKINAEMKHIRTQNIIIND